jgi:hypothetical protein
LLLEINTRVWLTGLARPLGRPATLDDIPDSELDRFARTGFDWIWLLSVWQTGATGQRLARNHPDWRREFQEILPDLCDDDIAGSGFAITGYLVPDRLGGNAALARLRERCHRRGLRLMLDFVPNHTGLDHPWVEEHPECYLAGTEPDLARAPASYVRIRHARGDRVLAHGRDPYFPAWTDTLQLDYSNPATLLAMTAQLERIAGQCDGVRCDMAMLVLPEVFERTWGIRARPFWPEAIQRVRERAPDFCFLAEVYWDLERTLQEQGFDYTYDKRLYDHLREGRARAVRDHFSAGLDYQNRLVRFLENHDEPRAATAFPPRMHEAAAVITFLAPGLRFFHQGQCDGRHKRIPAHLVRAPEEPVDPDLRRFYDRLLELLQQPILRRGQWQPLECVPACEGNNSSDSFVGGTWQDSDGARLLVAVNYASHPSQCRLRLPFAELGRGRWRLRDRLGHVQYECDGRELQSQGLYLDLAPWQYHVLEWNVPEAGSKAGTLPATPARPA